MALKPWYTVVQPREDLRDNRPLDAAEFAVHLDQVRDGSAPPVYRDPEKFFARTYLTKSLTTLTVEVLRRLSGEKTETSAIFNMATQFGGGKTHALTLLYHLAKHGPVANRWPGIPKLLEQAQLENVPKAQIAIFVGTEFDSITGRGGTDGSPLRKTPWGEIAYQLGQEAAFELVAEHEKRMIAPAGDVIRQLLPKDKPCLILIDELMNYISRNRQSGLATQLYNFLQNLSEVARGLDNVVLAVSIPASELEMNSDDHADYDRIKKLLDRLGKAIMMSAEKETSEIIRRRLFEWNEQAVTQDGRVLLPREAIQTCSEYAAWVAEHRQLFSTEFSADHAREAFEATYPFHPNVLSVFERKWRALPRFQQTRGVLRLLALWVARAYQEGYKNVQRDALIDLGSAPLDEAFFRAAVFEQLGESRLDVAVTTDICGTNNSHATRLDKEASEDIKKARLHRKVATTILFESNGGQLQTQATLPEIRLAVGAPGIDIANIETVLEALVPPDGSCYYLDAARNKYWFSVKPNLNKLLSDRRASVKEAEIEERVRAEIQKVLAASSGLSIQPVYFPEKSSQIADRPALTLVVLAPEHAAEDEHTLSLIEDLTRNYGTSSRTFKSALVWCVADNPAQMREEARKLLAWERIQDEESDKLDEGQQRQLRENLSKAKGNLKETVWRSYKILWLLGKDNRLRKVDLGMPHSSSSDTMLNLIVGQLRSDGDVEKDINPNFLVRNWPPAFREWSTRGVRDAFFASPQFPRLLSQEAIKDTIARGVSNGVLAYVSKTADGTYEPFRYNQSLSAYDIEISDDVYIISKDVAEAYKQAQAAPKVEPVAVEPAEKAGDEKLGIKDGPASYIPTTDEGFTLNGVNQTNFIPTPDVSTKPQPTKATSVSRLSWTGEVPPQKWMNFYTRVLTKYANTKGLKLTIKVEVEPEEGISPQRLAETRTALRELGLDDNIATED